MPKKPMDYSRTIIYKIVCKDLLVTDVYVGHTTDFIKRKCYHKGSCNNPNDKKHNQKIYQTIRNNGNWDNWEMIEIEKYECKDGNEARAKERYWYEYYNATLNSCVPNRSQKECKKEYSETNKKKLREQITCECGGHYLYTGKARHLKTPKHIEFSKQHITQNQQHCLSRMIETELEVDWP